MFYWTLVNIHPAHRSTLHCIQLLAVAKTADIKSYGMDSVLAPMVKDLKTLATEVRPIKIIVQYITCMLS